MMTELETFRAEKDRFFASDSQSPLTRAQKRAFHGLNYFPENPALRLEVTVQPFASPEEIHMQTTSGDEQVYTRYARLQFSAEGQAVELTLYLSESGYFLPFVDSQANHETYGAGRYLEPEPLDEAHTRFLLDFNLAYNPSCAYNDAWSCPLTPFENHLKLPIKAGEKVFHP